MNKLYYLLAFVFIIVVSTTSCDNSKKGQIPTKDGVPQLSESSIDEVIEVMTVEEKAKILIGTGMEGSEEANPVVGATKNLVPGAAGTTYPIPRLGIPAIVLADGPAGLRIQPKREDSEETFYCTAFPIATLLASTWNTELIENVGKAMGNEVLEYGCDIILGPGMNIHRNPLCGRNFEYYSEDPLLTGKMAAAMVKGIQSNGVGTSTKHFAFNNQETNRMGNDARISERAQREIYLKGFEIAVKEAEPWTIMSSYNKIDGVYTSESRRLLTDITRGEWKFKGLVMSDWYGGKDGAAQVYAGNDLLMPGKKSQYEDIINGINNGTLAMEDVDICVRRVLELIVRSPRFKGYEYSNKPDLKAHAETTRQSATEGMILLKNEETLPLSSEIKEVALFGNTSYQFIAGGTGSGDVNEAYTVSLEDGLKNAGYTINSGLSQVYGKYLSAEKEKKEKALQEEMKTNQLAAFLPKAPIAEFSPSEKDMKDAIEQSDVIFITLGRNSGEFFDRKEIDDFLLTAEENLLINKVTELSHNAGKKVVVVLNIGGVIETASWKKLPDAILLAWQGGQEGGNSVADILKGNVCPSGKLSMTFPIALDDHPSSKNFPKEAPAPDFSAFTGGKGNAKSEQIKNVDYTEYEEGIWVGYRAFEHFTTAVSYPFGYGLSYTTFEYSNPIVKKGKKGVYTITCEISNTGKFAGKEIVELYVSAPGKDMEKPVKELKAFTKTQLLQPGEKETVTMTICNESLASFDETKSAWITEKGEYQVIFAASSADIKLQVPLEVR